MMDFSTLTLASVSAVLGDWWPLLIPPFVAIATPLTAIVANHSVRLNRIKAIHGFARNFLFVERRSEATPCPQGRSDCRPPRDIRRSPSFEFVISKYIVDLDEAVEPEQFKILKMADRFGSDGDKDLSLEEKKKYESLSTRDRRKEAKTRQIEYIINDITPFALKTNRRAILLSVLYVALVWIGFFFALGDPMTPLSRLGAFVAGGLQGAECSTRATTVLSIAFMGGYLASLTLLTRAVVGFDLSGTTMLRAFLNLLGSVLWAVVIWRSLGLWTGGDCSSNWYGLVYALVFFVAFVPDAGPKYLAVSFLNRFAYPRRQPKIDPRKGGGAAEVEALIANAHVASQAGQQQQIGRTSADFLSSLKLTDGRFAPATKSIPLDVIDGIDFFTRFRLEEAGVYEVQNLAVANPILLHVETPFGIYQTIDWVAQAQLCTVVGPERFLILRQFNIRTIFDLELAVLSVSATSEFRRIIAGILLMTTETTRQIERLGGSKFSTLDNEVEYGVDLAKFSATALAMVTRKTKTRYRLRPLIEEKDGMPPCGDRHRVTPITMFPKFAAVAKFHICRDGEENTYEIWETDDPDATIKHMVRVIMDDLHVMRLRQVWEAIYRRLTQDSLSLDDSEEAFLTS